MPQKKVARDYSLNIVLRLRKKLPLPIQTRLWQNLLGADFRSSMGRPDIDHIVGGGRGESHIEYRTASISVTLYDDGDIHITDEQFVPARSAQAERILASFLRAARRSAHKRVDFRFNASLHLILTGSSLRRFMKDNIRFNPTRRFREAFGKYRGVRSFLIQISDDLDLVLSYPDHLDFLYHGTITTDLNRKAFVNSFVSACSEYVNSIRRNAP